MDPSKNLEENLDEFKKITVSLANIDENISDENQAIIILNSLPDSFKDMKAAIRYGRESLSLDDVLGALWSRDLEIKFEKKHNSESLQVRGRSQKRDQFKPRGKGRSKSKSNKTYWQCHKEGHFRRNCPERRKVQDGFLNTESANITQGYESGEVLTMCTAQADDQWLMDLGCTYHMTSRKDLLFDFKVLNGGKVLMGNDQTCSVTGIGLVKIQLWDGTIRVIENVRLVPKLRRNLLSLGMLDANGYSYKAKNGILKVMKGTLVVLKGSL